MPCTPFRLPDGTTGIICTGRGRSRARCFYCAREHERLCDFAVAPGKTCDRRLCGEHAHPGGKDRDLCPDHVNAKPAPPPELAPGPLHIFTGNVHRHRHDPDALDVTLLSGGPEGRPFAPSVVLFTPARRAVELFEATELEARARELDGDLHGAAELRARATKGRLDAWNEYRRGYLAEMVVSSGRKPPPGWEQDIVLARARGVVEHVEAWTAALKRRRRVFLCYEPSRDFCHRGLLAAIFVKLGAIDGGELPASPPGQASLFPSLTKD